MKKILLLAAFIYFLIAPLTYHPDNKEVLFWASSANGSVWNIWEYGEKNLPPDKQYGYPPFHFYLDKLQYAMAAPLAGKGFEEWIATPHKDDLNQPKLARFMMASKFSLILFGLLTAYFIFLLAKKYNLSEKKAKIAACIWLFNPITLYSIPMMGQNDVLAIVFFLGGWLLLFRFPKLAAVVFGLAASIKIYPLIWLVFLLPSFKGISIRKKIWLFVLSALVYGLTLVPFLNNPTFLSVGMKPELNARFLFPQISIGFGQAIYVIPTLLAILLFVQTSSPIPVLLTANLLILGFSHFHPQWYTWTIPFFSLWIVSQNRKNTIYHSLLLAILVVLSWFAVVIMYADKWLSIGMLGVGNPSLGNLPVLREYLLMRGIDLSIFDNFAHTALAAVGILALISLISKRYEDQSDKYSIEKIDHILSGWGKIPKITKLFLLIMIGFGSVTLGIGVLQLVPSPISKLSSLGKETIKINNNISGNFVASHNNLFRYDITFHNPKRNNSGTFLVSMSDRNSLIHQQTISGYNIGENSTIRFDLPNVQSNSKGRTYDVKIVAIEGTRSAMVKELEPQYVFVDSTSENIDPLVINQFYKPSQNLSDLVSRTKEKIGEIVSQMPWYYIGIVILMGIFVWL